MVPLALQTQRIMETSPQVRLEAENLAVKEFKASLLAAASFGDLTFITSETILDQNLKEMEPYNKLG